MDILFSPELEKELKRIKLNDKRLFVKIEKQLGLFQTNCFHPSLRTHKLTGKLGNMWSISIDRNCRMLYLFKEKRIYFFDIGTHDRVYRK